MTQLEKAIEIVKSQTQLWVRSHNLPSFIQSDDLLQEALVRMLWYIPNYDPSKGELKTFLSQYMSGAIQDFLRKNSGYNRHRHEKTILVSLTVPVEDGDTESRDIDVPDPRADTEADCINAGELPEFLKIAGKSLPQKYWLILVLYYWEDKSMKESGELLGINESRVSQIHDSALNKLSAVLYRMGIVRASQLIDS